MIILIDSSQGTITVLADNGFPWKLSEKEPYVAKCINNMHIDTENELECSLKVALITGFRCKIG